MANLKFSDFTPYATTPVTATSGLVAYEGTTNIQFTPVQLAPFTGIYAANGIIGTARTALLTDILRFRDFTNSNDIFTLNSNGTFTLGKSAVNAGGYSNVSIGDSASTASTFGVAVGRLAVIGSTHSYATAVGNQATSGGSFSIQVGGGSTAAAGSIAIGYSSGSAATYAHNYGYQAEGAGNNSITFNASGTSAAAPSTQYAFGVYMSSNTTPDFQVAHDGNSFITGTGNFGIGTSSPLYTLDTKGSVAGNWLARVENDSGTGLGLQVKVNSTDSTKRTFSTRNAGGYTMSVYNDGVVEINGQAYTELYTNATNLVVDWNNGNVQTVTVSATSPTFAPSNPKAGATYILMVTQGATPTGISWDGTVKWSGGAPTLSSTTGQIDVITLICYDAAANSGAGAYYGSASLNLVL